jgi:hypothetical protein
MLPKFSSTIFTLLHPFGQESDRPVSRKMEREAMAWNRELPHAL